MRYDGGCRYADQTNNTAHKCMKNATHCKQVTCMFALGIGHNIFQFQGCFSQNAYRLFVSYCCLERLNLNMAGGTQALCARASLFVSKPWSSAAQHMHHVVDVPVIFYERWKDFDFRSEAHGLQLLDLMGILQSCNPAQHQASNT